MAVALQVLSVHKHVRGRKTIRYKVTLSGNYVAGGDTIDLTQATNPSSLPAAFFGRAPEAWRCVQGFAGNDAEIVPGTTLQNAKLKMFSAANTEIVAGAYNAALTGDANLVIEAEGSF